MMTLLHKNITLSCGSCDLTPDLLDSSALKFAQETKLYTKGIEIKSGAEATTLTSKIQ